MDPFRSLDNLNSQFASVTFCRNSEGCNTRNGAVIDLPIVDRNVSSLMIGGCQLFSTLVSVMLSIAVLTNGE